MTSQVDDVEKFGKERQHDVTAINALPPKYMSTTTHVQRYEDQALSPLHLSKSEQAPQRTTEMTGVTLVINVILVGQAGHA
jgi:hypothetical protein